MSKEINTSKEALKKAKAKRKKPLNLWDLIKNLKKWKKDKDETLSTIK